MRFNLPNRIGFWTSLARATLSTFLHFPPLTLNCYPIFCNQLDISHHKHGANLKLDLDKDDNGEGSKPASGGEAADGDGGGK
jgi:hypothetical protein